jgi:hypothetical protein
MMVDDKQSNDKSAAVPTRKIGVVEEHIGNIGAKTGSVVDKVMAAPENLLHSAMSTATGAVDKAAKVAGDLAQDVANRLHSDSDKK